jgi:hypothetical protein
VEVATLRFATEVKGLTVVEVVEGIVVGVITAVVAVVVVVVVVLAATDEVVWLVGGVLVAVTTGTPVSRTSREASRHDWCSVEGLGCSKCCRSLQLNTY